MSDTGRQLGEAAASSRGGFSLSAAALKLLREATASLLGPFEDVEKHVATAVRAALPALGQWCFVNLCEADGNFRQADIISIARSDVIDQLRPFCVLCSGLSQIDAETVDITADWCEKAAQNAAHAELLAAFRGSSALIVPLRIETRLLGALIFVSASAAVHTGEAVALAMQLGAGCAMALDHARRYREAIGARDRAEKASRAKDEFLAVLSHELRNPLMPLVGWIRMLGTRPAIAQDPLLSEGVRSMERNARTLERLVGDCLDLARISKGGIRLERKAVHVNQIVVPSIESVKEMAAQKGLRLDAQMIPDSVLLLGDPMRLEQVMVNLLLNAVKYTRRGGSVSVRCARAEGEVEIEVKDDGAGIHPAFLEQIFEPFRRGSSSWLTNQSGLGLGLAIARQIVEMHGGRIWAESAGLDAGSTFRVRLPMAAAAITESPRDLTLLRESDGGAGLRILIIEDSEDISFLLKIELETIGHVVFTAPDGIAGLALAETRRPDLIISDIKMPGMDGLEFIRQLRASEELALTPAIALTGLGGKSGFDRAIEAGFDACVCKPAEPREISALIRKLTEKKQ